MRENNAYCFPLRIAHLLIFIHNGGFEIVLYSPDLKMILIFLVMTFFQKGTMFTNEAFTLRTNELIDYLYKHGYNRYFLQREYYELTISHGQKHLRPGNLSGFLVKAKSHPTQPAPGLIPMRKKLSHL